MTVKNPSLSRRLVPLAMSGFFNSFTDSGFKVWAVLLILQKSPELLQNPVFLSGMAAVCLLPSLLLPWLTGFTADRLPGRCVIALTAMVKIILLCCADAALGGMSVFFWVLAVLYSLLNAFFPPAFDGLLPETFAEKELSRACSRCASASTLGFICGIFIICSFRFV